MLLYFYITIVISITYIGNVTFLTRFSIVISLESSVDSHDIAKSGCVPSQSGAHSGGPDLRSAFPGGFPGGRMGFLRWKHVKTAIVWEAWLNGIL